MNCGWVHKQLSPYLDGELNVDESCEVLRHVEDCGACRLRLQQMRAVAQSLSAVPPVPAPPRLALKLRVAASHYSVRHEQLEYLKLRLGMMIRAMAVPAAAGMMGAVCIFAFLLGSMARGLTMASITQDVPLTLSTPPRLARMPAFDIGAPVIVDATVNEYGRVDDYKLLSGPSDQRVISRVGNQLLFTVFEPATAYGHPISGHVVLQYNSVRVRG